MQTLGFGVGPAKVDSSQATYKPLLLQGILYVYYTETSITAYSEHNYHHISEHIWYTCVNSM